VRGKHFVSLVPYWATWPFETLVLPTRRHIPSLAHLDSDSEGEGQGEEVADLALVLGKTTAKMDNLFKCSFAYSMGIYQAPVHGRDAENEEISQLFFSFYPPLLRSATVKKFLVG
jgi:UDPglucose--hexose-1-phosphate uridylyltransferase